MLVAAAVCPHPPLLVPALAAGAAAELDEVRAECFDAVGILIDSGAPVHVYGADTGERDRSFARWGVDTVVDVPVPSPLPHLVAAWLLGRAGASATGWHLVAPDARPDECAALGRELAAADVALLVMGDGSARHSEKAPGYLDARAADYDGVVAAALRDGDPEALAHIDPVTSTELLAVGRAPWQVLAGAAAGREWAATARFAAPYGVGYHVATWR